MMISKPIKPSFIRKCFKVLAFLLIMVSTLSSLGIYGLYQHIKPQLPDISGLKAIKLEIPLSIFSQDGKLIAQFGEKKRIPLSFVDMPERLTQAFIAAEDKRFFHHPGVDYKGLLRAGGILALTGEKRQGGSTITMQVARNFFLTREKTFTRKIKEILLALEIEQQYTKQEILELYLNKIYLGHRAYGVGAAAQVYYGKKINALTLAQWAMLAGLPKAPSNLNPITSPKQALSRRNYILLRMLQLQFISRDEYLLAKSEPETAYSVHPAITLQAPYVAEMVRKKMIARFGTNAYVDGLKVYTTLDSRLQMAARNALHRALHEYDQRHGYRGAENHIDDPALLGQKDLNQQLKPYAKIGDTIAGIVLASKKKSLVVYLDPARTIEISWSGLRWAKKYLSVNSRGPPPKIAQDITKTGAIVRVRKTGNDTWVLAQVPEVQGALISLNPMDGGILALTGGFDFYQSMFNRATQAKRQSGSGFKPILYTKALEEGYTTASIINDAPMAIIDPWSSLVWRPKNFSGRFYGPTRLRVALRKSRNLVSVRLLQEIGIEKVVQSAMRFGLPANQIPRNFTMALGSGSATPLEMARVYAVFANGGFLIEPNFILRIENYDGKILEQTFSKTACPGCGELGEQDEIFAPRVISPEVNYLMTSLLKDVVQRGTATRAKQLDRSDIAGKTGTTNKQKDAWFNGYTPSLATSVWVGFDTFKSLGSRETGERAALPMWIDYTQEALKNVPVEEITQPEKIISVHINPLTGYLAFPDNPYAISEIFHSDNVPKKWGLAGSLSPYPHKSRENRYASDEGLYSPIQSLF